MPILQLKKLPSHFISSDGIVFKIESGKEVRVRTTQGKKNKRVYVEIEKKPRELVYLMMEYFGIKFTPYDKLRFTITEDLRIPLNSISVKPFIGKIGISKDDEALLYKFKCDAKANGANARAKEKITPLQVFQALMVHNATCVYCGSALVPETWHLDHFSSLSKGGKNVFENLVPSCGPCNIMKGALDGNQFYARCVRITKSCVFAGKDVLSVFKPYTELAALNTCEGQRVISRSEVGLVGLNKTEVVPDSCEKG